MKTIQKENRVEQINDTDLPEAIKHGWREIDPTTGEPVGMGKDQNALAFENTFLKARIATLEAQLSQAGVPAGETAKESKGHKGKGKAAVNPEAEHEDTPE